MTHKPLLLFAHRGEAKTFFTHDNLQPFSQIFPRAFENSRYYLLITNEGFQETTENLTHFLAIHHNQISKIINMGVAGSLNDKTTLETVYPIKTIYGENEFKSFNIQTPDACHDLISSKTSVDDSEKAKTLSSIASIVDREAWAIASIAKKFNLDFYCYKLISDRANSKDIHKQVKEKHIIYSQKLYNFYKTIG